MLLGQSGATSIGRPPAAYASQMPRVHGEFRAGEVGEMAGVSGTTIGQWARRGLIRSSQRDEEPRLYSVEDVAKAAIVPAVLDAGARHAEARRATRQLPARA